MKDGLETGYDPSTATAYLLIKLHAQRAELVVNIKTNEQLYQKRLEGVERKETMERCRITEEYRRREGKNKVLLSEVERAISQCETGERRLCTDCGRPITWERLMAMPTAFLCVPCRSKKSAKTQYALPRSGPFNSARVLARV